ncbi:hypothetical protein L3N51_00146 [Metallosphaera sp. J1]|uniref:hypothetical protein n=1 Tax=Metallosphaera TaxID=41980 RepID=UPI001EDFB3C6|nr:hypothetical protein [Metallosphaera javensis (ex Hofmann et al. 2022)]MCG3107876.1 hypothetical protein [Metallosphaera javensis (ex Hofmann et al. 2022)]BCS91970.1 MAG: hypothetical protein MjAS7_0578 [Metallosphaera javensis (ex Sakai et al. 2022)]
MTDLATIQIVLIAAAVAVIGGVTYATFEEILTGIPTKKEQVKVERKRKGGSHGR